MQGIDDTWADHALALTGPREGDEVAEGDDFRGDVAQEITLPDRVISDLGERLAAARGRAAEADVDRTRSDDHRRETSVAAARLLEMASGSADRMVADARAEADSLVAVARTEANSLVAVARTEAERLAAELAARLEQQTAELDRHRTTVLRELADRQASTEAKLRTLRLLESEHRNELRRHFTEQLAQLEDITPEVPLAAVGD